MTLRNLSLPQINFGTGSFFWLSLRQHRRAPTAFFGPPRERNPLASSRSQAESAARMIRPQIPPPPEAKYAPGANSISLRCTNRMALTAPKPTGAVSIRRKRWRGSFRFLAGESTRFARCSNRHYVRETARGPEFSQSRVIPTWGAFCAPQPHSAAKSLPRKFLLTKIVARLTGPAQRARLMCKSPRRT